MQIGNSDIPKISRIPTADDYNKLVNIINSVRKISLGPNMTGSFSKNGICLDAIKGDTSIQRYNRIFDLSNDVSGSKIDFYRCYLPNASVTIIGDDLSINHSDISVSDNIAYLGVKLDTTDDSMIITTSTGISDLIDTSLIENSSEVKILLYKIKKIGSNVTILDDYRDLIRGANYV